MISSKIVKEKTGLTPQQLNYLRKLGLIPSPTRIYTSGQTGSTSAYPATVLNRIRLINILRAKGISLAQIARQARGTPFACPDPGPSAHEKVTK